MEQTCHFKILVISQHRNFYTDFCNLLNAENGFFRKITRIRSRLPLTHQQPACEQSIRYEICRVVSAAEAVFQVQTAIDQQNPFALLLICLSTNKDLNQLNTLLEVLDADHRLQIVVCSRDGVSSWQDKYASHVQASRLIPGKNPLDELEIGHIIYALSTKWCLSKQYLYQMTYDALTDLPNRVLMKDKIHQAILRAKYQQHQIAVLFLDLDRFQLINDTLGHSYGDLLLKQVATRLKRCVSEQDTVAYYGGDEFVIVLSSVMNEKEAGMIAYRILTELALPYEIDTHRLMVTASMGISLFPNHGQDAEALLKHADTAMYRVKSLEHNNFQFYADDMMAQALEYFQLEHSLRVALERNEFVLQYQPIYDLNSKKIVSTEALIRWQHPLLGTISPQRFIPLAEETGLIISIGEWVLTQACRQNKYWQECGYQPIKIAVNLSPYQVQHRSLVTTLENVLDKTQLSSQYLELEITESSLMGNTSEIIKTLNTLKTMGVSLSIDDFGTGYSNLSYLSRLPIGKLKIDQSFIRQMVDNSEDIAIVLTIISLAETLKIPVVAEGVETQEQLAMLKTHGCREAQGYYFSYPVNAKEYEQLLRLNDV